MRPALLLLLAAVVAAAQTATLEGRVVSSAGNQGVRRARVTARRPGLALTVETNSSGAFRIDGLTPGVYTLAAGCAGFQPATGSPLEIDAGVHLPGIVVTLTPLAVISGRIVDMDGDPLSAVTVEAMRYAYRNGKRQLRAARIATSDDRGQYRLFDLVPGRYFIQAVRRGTIQVGRLGAFHPAAVDVSGAAPVVVAPGDEAQNIDVRVRAQGLYQVHIRVPNAIDGIPPRPGMPMPAMLFPTLLRRGADFGTESIPLTRRGSVIEARNLAPGGYVFTARQIDRSSRDPSAFARLVFEVTDHDLDLAAELSPGLTVDGRLTGLSEPGTGSIRLESIEEGERQISGAGRPAENGQFSLKNLLPGPYFVRISIPEGHYLHSLRSGARELPSQLLEVASGTGVLEIRMADDGGEIAGLATDAEDRPVEYANIVLEPVAADWPDRVKTVRADDHGNFRIHDAAPGEYRIFAWKGDEPDESRAVNVKVEVNGDHRITLRIP